MPNNPRREVAVRPASWALRAAMVGMFALACGPAATTSEPLVIPALHPSIDAYPDGVVELLGPDGRAASLAVKIADTAERRSHGLMEVEELPDGLGMWFVFDSDRRGGFWMMNVVIPLDIAFFDQTGTPVALLTMQPCEQDPCEVYDPGTRYRYALEVPAGWFAKVGLDARWRVSDPQAIGAPVD